MNALEQLIRPSISTVRLASRRIVSRQTANTRDPVLVAWGSAGSLPSPTKEEEGGVGFKIENCNEVFDEKKRKTHDQTITDSSGSGASVTFTITDNITFAKKPIDGANVGSLRTETTSFSVPDPFAGTPFGDVSKSDQCSSSYALKNE